MTPLRCLVVDDHPVVRAGLLAVLAGQPGLEVVGEAAGGDEALTLCAAVAPDVVLCDLRLGEGPDGVDVTRTLMTRPDPPAVVILTTFDHDADIVRAVEAGAAGYLLKDAPPRRSSRPWCGPPGAKPCCGPIRPPGSCGPCASSGGPC